MKDRCDAFNMTLNECILAVIQIKDNITSPALAQSYHQYQEQKQKGNTNVTVPAYAAYLKSHFHRIDAPRGINKHLQPLRPLDQYPDYNQVERAVEYRVVMCVCRAMTYPYITYTH